MESRLILFDLDGTLVDTAGAGRRAFEEAFRNVFGLTTVSYRGVRFAGMTDRRIFRDLATTNGIDPSLVDSGTDRFTLTYLKALREEMKRPDPEKRVLAGVASLLESLCRRPELYLGLLTGNIEQGARIKLEPFGLNRYFPAGGFGSDHPDRREVARIAWQRVSSSSGIDFTPAQVVVVGDTEEDVGCARANGFHAVAVDSGWVSSEVLEEAAPDAILPDFTDKALVYRAFGIEIC